jgi:Tol biopolymer transport system component
VALALAIGATAAGGVTAQDTPLLQETFEDGSADGWNLWDGWSVHQEADGNHVLFGEGLWQWAVYDPGVDWVNYAVSFRVKLISGGVQLNCRMESPYDNRMRYIFGFRKDTAYIDMERPPDRYTILAEKRDQIDFDLGVWHDIVVSVRGPRQMAALSITVDGVPQLEFQHRQPLRLGTIGFETLEDPPGSGTGASYVYIDDIQVRGEGIAAATTGPTDNGEITSAGEEETSDVILYAYGSDYRRYTGESDTLRATLEMDIWMRRISGGEPVQLTASPAADVDPAWAPDRTRFAFASSRAESFDIYVQSIAEGSPTQLTDSSSDDRHPTWSPNGQHIAFTRESEGEWPANRAIHVVNADGSGLKQLCTACSQPAWSPDGQRIAFVKLYEDAPNPIAVMDADGTDVAIITDPEGEETNDAHPSWSPDGERIAFCRKTASIRDIRWIGDPVQDRGDVYTISADGTNLLRLTRSASVLNTKPTWSPDGATIAFAREHYAWTLNVSPYSVSWSTTSEIYTVDAEGGETNQLTDSDGKCFSPSWAS